MPPPRLQWTAEARIKLRIEVSCSKVAIALAVLKTIFNFVLGSLPPGGPGEGPDYQFSKGIGVLGPVPARIPGDFIFLICLWALSH